MFAILCLLAVATATPYGYYSRSYYGRPAAYNYGYYGRPAAYNYGRPTAYTYRAPAAKIAKTSAVPSATFNPVANSNSKSKVSSGLTYLNQAMEKLNELAALLPTTYSNNRYISKEAIVKVNSFVNDVCARSVAELPQGTIYSNTQKTTKEICDYVAKVGEEILEKSDNPAELQKYIAEVSNLQKATTQLIKDTEAIIL